MPDTLIGTILDGRYELLEELGHGQCGVVFKARQTKLNRIFAVKILLEDILTDSMALPRFEREASSAACLNHPNIVSVIDVGVAENKPYMVMEYIQGQHLGDVFGADGRLPLSRALRITSQICLALDHAHKAGVVHRDLKPTNVMLIDLEEMPDFVKVVDFGIAKKYTGDEDEHQLTMAGQVFGTPVYMSPEQCQGMKLDPRSDVYSLGVLLFRMLTGALPVTGGNLLEIMQAHVLLEPASFEKVAPNVTIPREIQQVVYRALEKDPAKRQQSMSAFRTEMTTAFSGGGATVAISAIGSGGSSGSEIQRVADALREAALRGDGPAMYQLSVQLEHDGAVANRAEAAHWLRRAADSGLKEAQWQLGNRFLQGDGYTKDPVQAVAWFTKAAKQNSGDAQFSLGLCYENGEGVERNIPAALHCYHGALENGHGQAKQRLSSCYRECLESGIEVPGLLEWLVAQAQLHDADAMYALAMHHMKSFDHRQRANALQLLAQAAVQGHPLAAFTLGVQQTQKQFENYPEAVNNLSVSHKAGNMEAALYLSYLVRYGLGTAPDPAQGGNLLEEAAAAEVKTARSILGSALLLGDGVHRNITRGITMLKESAQAGCHLGQWKLAMAYRNGVGCAKDPKETEVWLARAAEGRFPQGIPWFSLPNPLSFDEAVQFFKRHGAGGSRHGLYWMAICQEEGLGGMSPDIMKALDLYRQAAGKGLVEAQAEVKRLTANNQTAQMQMIRPL